ncbi:ATP-binding protein [uncultured Erythrobacter sp.]|uniref:two-component system sensor histidine kinase NtrB n=1 Tax=uncultured Erythrobacter sp. TaxID=263913 RepID=UPI002625F7D6|nr:ATP-binding protein [uncultured Erythrobacter sp.]
MAELSDLSSFDPARPGAAEQIAGLLFALVLVDPNLQVVELNQAAEIMLGKSAKQLVGKNMLHVMGPLDPRVEHRLGTSDAALVAREISITTGEAERRINLTASPLVSHPGWRVITLSEIGHEESGNDDQLASTMGAPSILAHEIKNPLAAIRGAAQLASRKLTGADTKLAAMITDEVDRIVRLIDRMQQLGARNTEVAEACNPHEAIRSAIATVRAAGTCKVEIIEEFDPSLPPVLANRDALEQVLINLISNARDAVRSAGQGQVTVRTRFVSGLAFSAIRLGRAVRLPIEITISDNGPGVDPAMRDHIFEPFVSSKQSGQGLGLALVRKLVHDMNGSISHERNAKKGLTRFRVHLPMAIAKTR